MADAPAEERKENYFLRTFCVLIIFSIVFVHYEPCYQLFGMNAHDFFEGIGRFAMPMFFMISGYFLYSADGHSERNLKKKTARILILLVIMKALYFVLDLIYYGAGIITADELVEGLIVMNWANKNIWFVVFLFAVYVLHWILYTYHKDFKYSMMFGIFCFATLLFTADICAWAGIEDIAGVSTYNIGQVFYCFEGFFFFPLGYYLHKHKDVTDGWSTGTLAALAIIGAVMSVWEVLNFEPLTGVPYSSLYLGSTIVAVPLFILTFRIPEDRLRCRPLEYMGRNMLPWMYAFYMAIMFFFKFVVMPGIDAPDEIKDGVGIIASAIIDIILSYLMYKFMTRLFGNIVTRSPDFKPRRCRSPADVPNIPGLHQL